MSRAMHSKARQAGVVALITSIIIGLLLVAITTGAIALMGGELRQGSDYDQSIRAYFAAEAGAEDALAHIRRQLAAGASLSSLNSPDCAAYDDNNPNLSGDNSVSYTCQVTSLAANSITDFLRVEESTQIDLSSVPTATTIVLSWNQNGTSDPQSTDWSNIPGNFTTGAAWSGVFPSVPEVTFFDYPSNQSSFGSSDIHEHTIVLKPSGTGIQNPNINLASIVNPESVECVPSNLGNYDCQATFQLISIGSVYYVMQIHARYSQMHYKIQAFQGSQQLTIANAEMVVDVTGKANDVTRRIRLQAPVKGNQFANFVLLVGDTICKVLEISKVTNNSVNGETGSCPQ